MADEQVMNVVSIYPGSSAERSLRFSLPGDKQGLSVREVVRFGVEERNQLRSAREIAEALRVEMAGDHGYTVNGAAVTGSEPILGFLQEKELEGQKYRGVDIVVASKQKGGIEYRL